MPQYVHTAALWFYRRRGFGRSSGLRRYGCVRPYLRTEGALERSAALLGWQMAGEVLVPGVLNEGDIDKTDGCRRAAELARSL